MRYLLVILFLFAFKSQSQESFEFKRDKQLHAIVGFGIGAGLSQLMIKSELGYDPIDIIVAPILPVTFIAMGKEFVDATLLTGIGEGADILYTMIGGAVGTIVTYSIHQAIKERRERKKPLKL